MNKTKSEQYLEKIGIKDWEVMMYNAQGDEIGEINLSVMLDGFRNEELQEMWRGISDYCESLINQKFKGE
jgi:hypothetical protein